MKNKTTSKFTTIVYIIIPLVVMIVFVVFFKNYQAEQRAIQAAQHQVEMEKQEIENKKKAELEKQLMEEAERLKKAREEAAFKAEKEEQEKRQKEIDQQKQLIAKVQIETNNFRDQIIDYSNKIKEERAKRKELEDKVWAMARENQSVRVEKNTNDLEAQRLTELLSNRVKGEWADQLMIQQALPPPTPAKR